MFGLFRAVFIVLNINVNCILYFNLIILGVYFSLEFNYLLFIKDAT